MKNLELNRMETLNASTGPFTDAQACDDLSDGITGSLLIWGAASLWAGGAGAGLILAAGAVNYIYGEYCDSL